MSIHKKTIAIFSLLIKYIVNINKIFEIRGATKRWGGGGAREQLVPPKKLLQYMLSM
jgi:hypothetical protein